MRMELTGEINDLQLLIEGVKNATEDVEIVINSPGGSVFEGYQLINAIHNCQHKVTAKIEVMACSAAAIIALACDEVKITKNDVLMLHNCWTVAVGNKEELQQEIEAMTAIDTIAHNIIQEHCWDDTIGEKMDQGEVWLTGEQVADLFEHAELVGKERPEGMAASAGIVDLVKMYQAMAKPAEEEPEKPEAPEEPEKKEEPEEVVDTEADRSDDPELDPVEDDTPSDETADTDIEDPTVESDEKKAEYTVPEGLMALLDRADKLE